MNSLHTNTSGFNDERLQRIPALLERYVSEGRSAGMQALVAHHGQIAHFSSHGLMNIAQQTPVRDDTLFRIFSMTKPVTGVALMMLYEQGKFGLEDELARRRHVVAALAPLEEARPQRVLELPDVPQHGGVRDAELAGRAPHGPLLRHRERASQSARLH